MLHIRIRPQWQLGPGGPDEETRAVDSSALLALLTAVQETGSLAQAARSLGSSYRHAWGQVQRAQSAFGQPLIEGGRGRNSSLTPLAQKLIWADKRVAARLSPLLDSLASELEGELARDSSRLQALRLYASHGFAVAALVERLEALALPVEVRYRNSLESVAALSRGECDLAGFHVPIGEFADAAAQRYRPLLNAKAHRLVHLAVRRQGLIVAMGNPKRISGLADLGRPEVRFVNRPQGSGTRALTELLLHKAGLEPRRLNGWDDTEITHSAVAAFIASGMADAGIGVQTAAQRFGLPFIPLLRERYYFAVPAVALNEEPVASALRIIGAPALRSRIAALVGYEAGETGKLLTLGEAFD
ncbi:substrate-binding domain-containing protein [Piscinibacter sakaiensis]|uniref:substrate-binding domain-containing protein n=1 Tax=Piscinibacter sakaiensis TaxID=1547922 RepID=UPI003AAB0979